VFPYPADGLWADPDLEQAAELMKRVFADPAAAAERGAAARRHMLERHSAQAAGEILQRRLELVCRRLYENGARSLNLAHVPARQDGEEIAGRITRPPSVDWGRGRAGRLRWRAQRPLADWVRAYVEHETSVDIELNRAIDRLDARMRGLVHALRGEQMSHHAETLALLRRLEAKQNGARREQE
jgi:hypothetical protein